VRLRTRFLLLTLSVIVVPFVLGSLLFLARFLENEGEATYRRYAVLRRWTDYAAQTAEPERFAELVGDRPDPVELAFVSSENRIRAGSIRDLEAGDRISLDSLLERHEESGESSEIVSLPLARTEGYLVAVLTRPAELEFQPTFLSALIIPVVIIAVIIGFSVWILRDMRKSILTLRDAALRIRSGELDFELDTGGTDEFAQVRDAFDAMRRTIREEYARRARFTMGVSHDLKTPLSLIRGYAEAIEDGLAEDPGTLEKYVRIIRERSDLLQERIEHLIEFLKLETGEWLSTLHTVRLAGLLGEVASVAATDAGFSGRRFDVRLRLPEDLKVELDPVLFRRAIENLAHNAVVHSPEGAAVRLEAWLENEDEARILVANEGSHVGAEDLHRLTEPLYRGDAARQTPGFGLGLAIVRTVVESHGWSLEIDGSNAGESRFIIRIPLSAH
jgi:signal transduction histidine kinase